MYYIFPWFTALYFVFTALVFWFVMWAGLWSTSVIVKMARSSFPKQR